MSTCIFFLLRMNSDKEHVFLFELDRAEPDSEIFLGLSTLVYIYMCVQCVM